MVQLQKGRCLMARRFDEATYFELFPDSMPCGGKKTECSSREDFEQELASYDEALYFFKDELNHYINLGNAERIRDLKRDVQRSKTERVRFLEANKKYLRRKAAV